LVGAETVALKYPRGTIILVSQVADPNGVNPKDRPVVLVRDFDDQDPVAYGLAVTGTFTHPAPPTSVVLPYHRQGRCATGLTKQCIADCTWVVVAAAQDVIKRLGVTPPIQLLTVLKEVQAHLPPAPLPPPPTTPSTGS
jgi:hypothetical protein